MRTATTFAFCLLVSAAVFYAGVQQGWVSEKDPLGTVPIAPLEGRPPLDAFLATLDPEVMKECVRQHERGREIDLDFLATCGDFDLYADYMGLSKYEAVKKFEYVMLYSSSQLEFEDRLAR